MPLHKATAKVFSTYNGCKWKGGKLKLEKAKEHYLVQFAQEMPAKDDMDKQEEKEKRKLEKHALETSKVNIYFPRLRKVARHTRRNEDTCHGRTRAYKRRDDNRVAPYRFIFGDVMKGLRRGGGYF
ncbi:hypothetical protein ZWY2020_003818 [Hordeum vulgare]|nr:hypothetical protein ZWY2020_003818 [Hordeum vulgare]